MFLNKQFIFISQPPLFSWNLPELGHPGDIGVGAGHIPYIGRPNDMFGIIVSIKEAFGVIQLLRSEDQIIFSTRDGNRDVAIGK